MVVLVDYLKMLERDREEREMIEEGEFWDFMEVGERSRKERREIEKEGERERWILNDFGFGFGWLDLRG